MKIPVPHAGPYPTTGTAPQVFYYKDYAVGCEPDEEPYLELTDLLHTAFDQAYPHDLLCMVLREQNPVVELRTVDEADGTRRFDWPWLGDDDLDRLQIQCACYISQPTRAQYIEELMENLLAPGVSRCELESAKKQVAA